MTDTKTPRKSTYPKVTLEGIYYRSDVPCFIKFESSIAAEALYNPNDLDLIITYNNGTRYVYRDVSIYTWVRFLTSESKGSYINHEIKGKFDYERIGYKDSDG